MKVRPTASVSVCHKSRTGEAVAPGVVIGAGVSLSCTVASCATEIFATDLVPKISVAQEATVHESDTPAPITTPGATASPVRDLWQTDTLAVGLTFMADWARRHDQA